MLRDRWSALAAAAERPRADRDERDDDDEREASAAAAPPRAASPAPGFALIWAGGDGPWGLARGGGGGGSADVLSHEALQRLSDALLAPL